MTQKQIQMAFAKQLAVSTKMVGDPFEGQSVTEYAMSNFAPEDVATLLPRLIQWQDECATHQGEARLHYFGEVADQPLEVYYAWESDLATLHEQWEVIVVPAKGQLPRLRKKVA